jgi:23S rRNA pseudouridine2605 synthase
VRLQKVLAERGVAVNGEVVRVLGTRVDPTARIEVDSAPVAKAQRHRYIALNKPAGIVSSARAERGRRSVVDLVPRAGRLYPVGRLDADSEGLVLLTNDGAWAERVLHPRYGHEREYEVRVEGDVTDAVVDRLRKGVPLEEGLARAERVELVSRDKAGGRIQMILRTGWKRQIRRMCAALGLRVVELRRVRIGTVHLGVGLAVGGWRELSEREVRSLGGAVAKPAPAGRRPRPRARTGVA